MVNLFCRINWHTNNIFHPVSRSALLNIFKKSVSTKKLKRSTKRFLEAPEIVSFYKMWYMQVLDVPVGHILEV